MGVLSEQAEAMTERGRAAVAFAPWQVELVRRMMEVNTADVVPALIAGGGNPNQPAQGKKYAGKKPKSDVVAEILAMVGTSADVRRALVDRGVAKEEWFNGAETSG